MLELAGPVLYEDVEIRTLQQLYSFFITPSLVPTASRLRPSLGLSRLQTLRIRIESSQKDLIESFIPLSTWNLPHRRLQQDSKFRIRLLSFTGPRALPLRNLMENEILPRIRTNLSIYTCPFPSTPVSSQLMHYEVASRQVDRNSRVDRTIQIPLFLGSVMLPIVQTKFTKLKPAAAFLEFVVRLDLRLVLVEQNWEGRCGSDDEGDDGARGVLV
ncbi:hypothetical protein BDY24DRAFT_391611 [Mrakia frigida]|uniref:uncharacterized protein n=1 Tax=Mrakia frigida TaxID=29902 RepID=UPI003FCC1F4E